MMSCITTSDVICSSKKGQIQVIFGPMFSGKTTELIRRIKRFQIANHSCLIVKYANDDRYDKNGIATHDREVKAAVSATELCPLRKTAMKYDVIGIDEGQFFPDCVEFSEEMASKGKKVIVAALDGTFQRKGFGNILNLVPLAESVIKLNAVCMHCYSEASYTKRLGVETAVEIIGGTDKYMAVCRACYVLPASHHHDFKDETPLRNLQLNDNKSNTTITTTNTLSMGRKLFKDSPKKNRENRPIEGTA
ncbi:thymidine kinase, cytosolic-like [Saccoglossus kowalevskii]|uniref:Thymidine kinase n=1 Tax=Saccoglossus kowalevskii TaxID=10224 RepID=A0ABM0GML2_SACKO|nr:PREDICTED: thymidine kinase, cytosolic-like [Saccoglossus kowalevskii]